MFKFVFRKEFKGNWLVKKEYKRICIWGCGWWLRQCFLTREGKQLEPFSKKARSFVCSALPSYCFFPSYWCISTICILPAIFKKPFSISGLVISKSSLPHQLSLRIQVLFFSWGFGGGEEVNKSWFFVIHSSWIKWKEYYFSICTCSVVLRTSIK